MLLAIIAAFLGDESLITDMGIRNFLGPGWINQRGLGLSKFGTFNLIAHSMSQLCPTTDEYNRERSEQANPTAVGEYGLRDIRTFTRNHVPFERQLLTQLDPQWQKKDVPAEEYGSGHNPISISSRESSRALSVQPETSFLRGTASDSPGFSGFPRVSDERKEGGQSNKRFLEKKDDKGSKRHRQEGNRKPQ